MYCTQDRTSGASSGEWKNLRATGSSKSSFFWLLRISSIDTQDRTSGASSGKWKNLRATRSSKSSFFWLLLDFNYCTVYIGRIGQVAPLAASGETYVQQDHPGPPPWTFILADKNFMGLVAPLAANRRTYVQYGHPGPPFWTFTLADKNFNHKDAG
jgi:hypothetical protein